MDERRRLINVLSDYEATQIMRHDVAVAMAELVDALMIEAKADQEAEKEQAQYSCDHDWDDIRNGKEQCTYLECQKIRDAD